MADTLENKVEGQMAKNRSLVERIAMYVPFYRGYKQKNLRRDEDRAIRDVVAKELFDVKNDLSNASRAAIGDLDAMRDSERIKAKVDKYYVDVKKAAAGYSAFHDSVKIMETELDNIISWDAQLIDGVQREHQTGPPCGGEGDRCDDRGLQPEREHNEGLRRREGVR